MPDMVINIRSTFDDAGFQAMNSAQQESVRSYTRMLADFANAPLPAMAPEMEEAAGMGGNYLTRMIARYAGRGIGTELGGRAGGMLGMIGGVGMAGTAGSSLMPILGAMIAAEAGIAEYQQYSAAVGELQKAWGGVEGEEVKAGRLMGPGVIQPFTHREASRLALERGGLGAGLSAAFTASGTTAEAAEVAGAGKLVGAGLTDAEVRMELRRVATDSARGGVSEEEELSQIAKEVGGVSPMYRGRMLLAADAAHEAMDANRDAVRRGDKEGAASAEWTANRALGEEKDISREDLERRVRLRGEERGVVADYRQEIESAGMSRQLESRHIEEQTRAEEILAETRERGAGSYGEKLNTELDLIDKTTKAEKDKLAVTLNDFAEKDSAAQKYADAQQSRFEREQEAYNKSRAGSEGPTTPYELTDEGRKLKDSADESALAAKNAHAAWNDYLSGLEGAGNDIDAVANAQRGLARETSLEETRRIAGQSLGFETALAREQLETQIAGTTGLLDVAAKGFNLTPEQRVRAQIAAERANAAGLGREAKQAAQFSAIYSQIGMFGATEQERMEGMEKAQSFASLSARYSEEEQTGLAGIASREDQEAFLAGRPYNEVSRERYRQQQIQQQIAVGRYRLGLETGSGIPTRRMGEHGTGVYRGMGEHPHDAGYHAMGEANLLPVTHGFITAIGKMTEAVHKATDAHNQPDSGPVQTLPVN